MIIFSSKLNYFCNCLPVNNLPISYFSCYTFVWSLKKIKFRVFCDWIGPFSYHCVAGDTNKHEAKGSSIKDVRIFKGGGGGSQILMLQDIS